MGMQQSYLIQEWNLIATKPYLQRFVETKVGEKYRIKNKYLGNEFSPTVYDVVMCGQIISLKEAVVMEHFKGVK